MANIFPPSGAAAGGAVCVLVPTSLARRIDGAWFEEDPIAPSHCDNSAGADRGGAQK
jgi:hypothetical protein